MRFLLGMIVGALLTIGAVYIADSRADPLQGTRMVNWDVVGRKVNDLTVDLQESLGRLHPPDYRTALRRPSSQTERKQSRQLNVGGSRTDFIEKLHPLARSHHRRALLLRSLRM